jgi:anti-sigma factor RsiW
MNQEDEARLHALVDGRLDPREEQEELERLARDPAREALVREWKAQREALLGLHRQAQEEPVPTHLTRAAREVDRKGRRMDSWQRWGGLAASVAIAFVLGWFANQQWGGPDPERLARRPLSEFGRQAVLAHMVYSPEVRHPVEVPAAQQEHLVQWLSKRLGRSLKVPDLTPQGYELVGGRLLPGAQGARAQFMYQNARAERITLYVGAVDPGAGGLGGGGTGETAFRFTTQEGASSFYWVDQGFGYALAGRLDRPKLLSLAETVHRQL